jgi:hypothetical protein
MRINDRNLIKLARLLAPELIFGTRRPEHIAAALNVLAESYHDTQNILDAFGVLGLPDGHFDERVDRIRRGENQLPSRLYPTVEFFMRNPSQIELFYTITDNDLLIEGMVFNICEAKLKKLPKPVASAGYRLLQFVTDYYDRLTRKYFMDYHPDLPTIIKIQLGSKLREIKRGLTEAFQMAYFERMLDDKRIDTNFNIFDTRNGVYSEFIEEYWPHQWKEVIYHLSRGNIDRTKKLLNYIKYVFSYDVARPEALEKLKKLNPNLEAGLRRLESMVGKPLPGLRALYLYWHETGSKAQIDVIGNYMMESLEGLAERSLNMRETSDLSSARTDINKVSRFAFGIFEGLSTSCNSFIGTKFADKYNAADFENMADLVYRAELVRLSGLMSIHEDRSYNGKLHMNAEILPKELRPYVWDIKLFEPRFENIRKFNWMVLKKYMTMPEFMWAARFRGRR